MAEKDFWDKFEILSKLAVGITVPTVVALTAFLLNDQINKRNQATEITRVAVGILQAEPNTENGVDHLRLWAIDVLRDPENPKPLSAEAAEALKTQSLGALMGGDMFELKDFFGGKLAPTTPPPEAKVWPIQE